MTKEQMLHDRIQYAIKELQEAEKLLAEVTDLSTAVDTLPTLKEMEERLIRAAFEKYHHHRRDVSRALGISEKTLYERLASCGLIQRKIHKSPTKRENHGNETQEPT